MKTDVYQRITDQIVCELEKGVRPWMKPWNAEHAAGRIMRPLRGIGIPFRGINVLMLWSAAMENGYAAPVWMTFKQASELKANVRKGERGSLAVYADKIIRAETDAAGKEAERAIPFMKGYTVFSVEQIDGLPEHYYAKAQRGLTPCSPLNRRNPSSRRPPPQSGMAAQWLIIMSRKTLCRCRRSKASAMPKVIMRPSRMRRPIMPTSGLCRPDLSSRESTSQIDGTTRHNHGDFRRANRAGRKICSCSIRMLPLRSLTIRSSIWEGSASMSDCGLERILAL
jgi:hypothetical protein